MASVPTQTVPEKVLEKEPEKAVIDHRTEGTAYLLNHALSCGITDTFIQPPIGTYVQQRAETGRLPKWLAWVTRIFENHDHHGPAHGHDHNGHDHSHGTNGYKPNFWSNSKHWFLGEAAGDIGAIPLTIMVRRAFPGLMKSMSSALEPLVRPRFRRGAARDAEEWAKRNHIDPNSPETKARENELYEYEIRHLPLAVIWNAFAIPINLTAQRLSGSKASWGTLALGKTFGSLVSNLTLIGGRAAAPAAFEKWDKFNSDKFVAPITNAILPSNHHSVDNGSTNRIIDNNNPVPKEKNWAEMDKHKHSEGKNWVERSEQPQEALQTTASR